MGFARYGFTAEAAQVARAVSGAGSFFALHQVPELYAGTERAGADSRCSTSAPTCRRPGPPRPASPCCARCCDSSRMPPGGGSGSTPALPEWLPEITLTGLRLGSEVLDLRITRGEKVAVLRGDPSVVEEGQGLGPWSQPLA